MNIEENLQFVFVFVTGENTLTNELKKIYFASLPEFSISILYTHLIQKLFSLQVFTWKFSPL